MAAVVFKISLHIFGKNEKIYMFLSFKSRIMEKFDLRDKKILYLLLENARLPASKIAEYVRLSKNAVPYRILRLIEKEVIWKFFAIINYRKIGVRTCDIFIKLKPDPWRENEIKNYFRKHPNVISASRLFGKWDVFLQIAGKSFSELNSVWLEIAAYLGGSLDSYESKLMNWQIKSDYQLFHDLNLNYRYVPKKVDEKGIYRLDNLDKKILSYLNEVSAIAKYQNIGKSIGASLETTRNHISRLVDEGVITRFVPFVRHKKIGLAQFIVELQFRHFTAGVEKEVRKYIKNSNNIRLAFRSAHRQEIYFWAAAEGHFALQEMLADIKHRFYENIVSAELMPITEDITLNLFPKALMSL